MRNFGVCLILLGAFLTTGCIDSGKSVADKGPTGNILEKTDKVGEFKEEDGRKILEPESPAYNPINPLSPLKQINPMKQKIATMGIDYQLKIFEATHGRFPKDHAEFMKKVIKETGLQLPKLPPGREYQYDVEKHKLVVVAVEVAEE